MPTTDPITVPIDRDLHQAAKIAAAMQRVTLKSYVEQAIKAKLEAEND